MVNWISAGKLPEEMIKEIQEFLEDESAKKLGFTSQQQVLIGAVREFLIKYKYIQTNPTLTIDSSIEYVSTIDRKIILNDKKLGIIIITIDNNNKMICGSCDDIKNKDCPHVAWCLLNNTMWDVLRQHNVKVRRIRE